MSDVHPVKRASEILGSNKLLAEKLGVNPTFISQLISGHRKTPPVYCREIENLTGGQVTAEDLRPDIFSTPDQAA